MDCPTQHLQAGQDMVVAVHNPANYPVTQVQVKMPPVDATIDTSATYSLFNAETGEWDELTDVSYEEGAQRPIVNHPDELVTDATLIFTLPNSLAFGQVSFIKISGYTPADSSDKIKSNMNTDADKGQKIWSDS